MSSKPSLISDPGGRKFARAMTEAYWMGYKDAKELKKDGRRIYPRKSGKEIAKEVAAELLKDHAAFLRQAYGAGMYQCRNESGNE